MAAATPYNPQDHQYKPRQPRSRQRSALEGTNVPPDGDMDFLKCKNGEYNCTFCTFKTNNPHRLRAHRTKHTKFNYYKCLGCGETFASVERMKIHIEKLHS